MAKTVIFGQQMLYGLVRVGLTDSRFNKGLPTSQHRLVFSQPTPQSVSGDYASFDLLMLCIEATLIIDGRRCNRHFQPWIGPDLRRFLRVKLCVNCLHICF